MVCRLRIADTFRPDLITDPIVRHREYLAEQAREYRIKTAQEQRASTQKLHDELKAEAERLETARKTQTSRDLTEYKSLCEEAGIKIDLAGFEKWRAERARSNERRSERLERSHHGLGEFDESYKEEISLRRYDATVTNTATGQKYDLRAMTHGHRIYRTSEEVIVEVGGRIITIPREFAVIEKRRTN